MASESCNLLSLESEKPNENANQSFPHPLRCKEERLVRKDVNDRSLNRCVKVLCARFRWMKAVYGELTGLRLCQNPKNAACAKPLQKI